MRCFDDNLAVPGIVLAHVLRDMSHHTSRREEEMMNHQVGENQEGRKKALKKR